MWRPLGDGPRLSETALLPRCALLLFKGCLQHLYGKGETCCDFGPRPAVWSVSVVRGTPVLVHLPGRAGIVECLPSGYLCAEGGEGLLRTLASAA